jgi:AraC family transcriptional regulator, regulatory protein of adaptative response / methylated-DNA-[protein]-cysteine methyltransferase
MGKQNLNTDCINQLCKYIQNNIDQPLPLKELSKYAGFNPEYLQKTFKSVVGLTPRQYIEACRLDSFKKKLRSKNNKSVTEAIFAAGFSGPSRVYERVNNRLGMTPAQCSRGGKNLSISYVVLSSQFGLILMAATDRGLCSIRLGDSKSSMVKALENEYPAASITELKKPYASQFQLWLKALIDHLKGIKQHLDLPMDIQGTAFQFQVWHYLQSIPYGQLRSYAEVAKAIGMPKAARAVGNACGANHLAIIIPCHRVIRGDGALGGYGFGIAYKKKLIRHEQAVAKYKTNSNSK